MKESYKLELEDLARQLTTERAAKQALQDTVEFAPLAEVIPFPAPETPPEAA